TNPGGSSSHSSPQSNSLGSAGSTPGRIEGGFERRFGGLPVSTSHNTPPRPYTSVRASIFWGSPRACSGAIYAGVPTTPGEFDEPIWDKHTSSPVPSPDVD